MRKGLAIIILVLMRFGLMGQEVDTIQVPNINITSTHSHQGDYIKPIESAATESVSKLLDSQSAFFLKSNGPGSSVTTSLLGGNASHTSLTLNGIPVTNPLIGQLDFSLLPIFFNQGMSLNTGLSPKNNRDWKYCWYCRYQYLSWTEAKSYCGNNDQRLWKF